MTDSWRAIAARKVKEQQDRIPSEWRLTSAVINARSKNVTDVPRQSGILSDIELHLTEAYDATALLDELAQGRIKSEHLTRAFCKRAAIATQVTNCLTEIFFDDAIARAKQLDSLLQKNSKPVGPLHGLPISIKDSFNVKGYDSSLGVAALCFKPATSNSAVVDLLLSLGAVVYCKTNIPQTLASLDSHNNIFGRTINPHNGALTAGGSSGGEGALLAMRGSPIGLGTDVGGSIRVPAMCNGLYGVKPSHGRVPYAGQQSSTKDGVSRLTIDATAGPIARSMRDCATFLRIIADNRPQTVDPDVFAQTWTLQPALALSSEPLRVGVVYWDGHTRPLPCIQAFMKESAVKLRNKGQSIEVVDVDASSLLSRCVKAFNGLVSVDGANDWFDLLESHGEPLSPWLQTRLRRRPRQEVGTYANLQAQRHDLQTTFLKIWEKSGGYWRDGSLVSGDHLDVLVCPPAPHPVAPIDGWNTVNYTAAWNLLDYPAGIIPVRTVTNRDLQEELPSEAPLNGWDKINQGLWKNREVYLGSPLSLQVVAPRLEERKLVESMAVIAEALGGIEARSRL